MPEDVPAWAMCPLSFRHWMFVYGFNFHILGAPRM